MDDEMQQRLIDIDCDGYKIDYETLTMLDYFDERGLPVSTYMITECNDGPVSFNFCPTVDDNVVQEFMRQHVSQSGEFSSFGKFTKELRYGYSPDLGKLVFNEQWIYSVEQEYMLLADICTWQVAEVDPFNEAEFAESLLAKNGNDHDKRGCSLLVSKYFYERQDSDHTSSSECACQQT